MSAAAAVFTLAVPPLRLPRARRRSPRGPGGGGVGTVGRKHAERLLTALRSFGDEPSAAAADRLARKFLASSSEVAALHTLSYLLAFPAISSSYHLAIPLYRRIRSRPWFGWNTKLAAAAIPALEKHGCSAEAEALISEITSSMKPRELTVFYGDLVESYARHGSAEKVFEVRSHLREHRLGNGAYNSVIRALCRLALPSEAEEVMAAMAGSGFRASPFEYRSLVQCYGKMGMFADMRRVLVEMETAGNQVDPVCANVVISCYGNHGELLKMVEWLRKMKKSGVLFSVRTYNSVLNACHGLCSMLGTPRYLPLSINELVHALQAGGATVEASLVEELVSSEVLGQLIEWSADEGKLDLHGCHMGSALVVVLQWIEEVKRRLVGGRTQGKVTPMEVSIVCGWGKHSSTTGESPIKRMVCELMFQMNSPLRIDRKNNGRLFARGKVVREWLIKLEGLQMPVVLNHRSSPQ